ncbi:MAG: DNA-3-methyladenine glycosylase 2 family protein [Xanthomonadales bacterium]|nr:DNA-3-methyladenine glycosylase 2 family protein [Xanthomonadales bacterium]
MVTVTNPAVDVPSGLPPAQVCEQARLSRDSRFDGLFFTAVTSTGIYCRPVCPAPAPRAANVRYYPSAAAAESAGFRPCLRCRPELAPAAGPWRRGDAVLARALALIEDGALAQAPLADLADRLHLGERQLRRLFSERLGASPVAVHGTRRLLFAKQLLTETAMPVTEVALAAGFGSLRRFHTVFRSAYRMPPGALRRRTDRRVGPVAGDPLELRLAYRPPFDFRASLRFLAQRSLAGIDAVVDGGYERWLGGGAFCRITAWSPDAQALRLRLQGVPPAALQGVVATVRRVFDLDAEPQAVNGVLSGDPLLAASVQRHPGLRLPGAWDGFETAVRAVLGQQVSVAAARTLATRLLERIGVPCGDGGRLFPGPAALLDADLGGLGLTGARMATLRTVAVALLEGRVDFSPGQALESFVARWTALPGIGTWTAHYLALRVLGHPDAFPADDLVLRRVAGGAAGPIAAGALAARAKAWRPWRAYGAVHLWRAATPPSNTKESCA